MHFDANNASVITLIVFITHIMMVTVMAIMKIHSDTNDKDDDIVMAMQYQHMQVSRLPIFFLLHP